MKKLLIALSVLSAALVYAEVPLMKNGSPACSIVPAPGDDPTAKHAAEELALYLGKIGGGSAPAIVNNAEAGKSSVVFELVKNPKIEDQGFQLETKGETLYIRAKKPLGLLYGAYEVLKKYGGIRWIMPGPQGEYFKKKSVITVPNVSRISNPSFKVRTFHFCIADWDAPNYATWDWMVRNNMFIEYEHFGLRGGKFSKFAEFVNARGGHWRGGWHCFTRLHKRGKSEAEYRKMFEEHPERFPLINGQRRFLKGQEFQPCTTNPDNIKTMGHNLADSIRQQGTQREGRFILVNNDNTSWCECADCKAAADPRETKEGIISTRYWKFINAIVAEARKELPEVERYAVGYGYQNYQPVPLGVMPNPKLDVMLSYNGKCYRHALTDPNCPYNRVYYKRYRDWVKKNPNVTTWEECSDLGFYYHALEFVYAGHLKEYHKLGIAGTCPSIIPMLSKYGDHLGKYKYRYQHSFLAQWQQLYLAALLQWDISTDVEKAWEEANALYYGAAWENGMRDYRKLLVKTSETTAGCFGYGMGVNAIIGRCLTAPGVKDKLLAYLDRAEQSVQDDPRALAAVKQDREFLKRIWIEYHNAYVKGFRQTSAYKITGKITIDGKLNEADWGKTDIISSFKSSGGKDPKHQTAVRLLFEQDYLYVAIEAMEPAMDRMVSVHTDKDGKVWEDNSVEVLINHPDMNNKYYQFIINDKGTMRDSLVDGANQDVSFNSEAQIAVGKENDRWVVEMKIPASMLGMKIFAGQTWRVNSQRYRVVKDEPAESSAMSASGTGNNVSAFLPLAFKTSRVMARDSRDWRNTDFSEWHKFKTNPKWTLEVKDGKFPSAWVLNMFSGKISMETREDNPQDKYLKLTDCRIYQEHKGTQKKYQVVLDAKGTGTLEVYVNRYKRIIDRYHRAVTGKGLGARKIFTVKPSPDKWQTFKGEVSKDDAQEILGFVLRAHGEVSIDNMFVMPLDDGK